MRFRPRSQIEAQAASVLERTGALRVPVPVVKVARLLNLRVEAAALGDGISGILVVTGGRGIIGYNRDHAPVRQRFTVAHEIGHFCLHQSEGHLFIDKAYAAVYRRDRSSSSGADQQEIQANQFAGALLMPEALVLQEFQSLDFDLGDEGALDRLAGRFEVSSQAMSIRLAHLGMFPSAPA
jgi:Zn-dependent peptidase ImmA (M78 family)